MAKVKRAKRKNFLVFKIAVVIFVVAIGVQIISIQAQLLSKKEELTALQQELTAQTTENAQLQQVLDSGINDEYVEDVAREKLGYVSPFERVFIDIAQE